MANMSGIIQILETYDGQKMTSETAIQELVGLLLNSTGDNATNTMDFNFNGQLVPSFNPFQLIIFIFFLLGSNLSLVFVYEIYLCLTQVQTPKTKYKLLAKRILTIFFCVIFQVGLQEIAILIASYFGDMTSWLNVLSEYPLQLSIGGINSTIMLYLARNIILALRERKEFRVQNNMKFGDIDSLWSLTVVITLAQILRLVLDVSTMMLASVHQYKLIECTSSQLDNLYSNDGPDCVEKFSVYNYRIFLNSFFSSVAELIFVSYQGFFKRCNK